MLGEDAAAKQAPPAAPTAELTREAPEESRSGLKQDHTEASVPIPVSSPAPASLEEAASGKSPVELDPEIESASLASLLRTIAAKINSIDSRLSNIEKKLGLS